MSHPTVLLDAVNRYLDIRRTAVAANTYKNDRVAMNTLMDGLGPSLPLRKLTRELFEAVFLGGDGFDRHMSASTFNAYLSRMKKFTQTALAYEWIDRDPLLGVAGRRRTPTPPRMLLAPEVLLGVVNAARSPRDRIAVAIAVNTGLRASEIVGLRVSDVDLAGGYLTAQITKTGDHDLMPITAELDTELRRWKAHYARWSPDGRLRDDWYLVPQHIYAPRHGTDGTMDYRLTPFNPVAQPYDIVKRCLEALSLPTSKEGFHTIRRSVGRAYYELMKPKTGHESALVATAALLHHKDIRQTQHYIGVQPERLERDSVLRGQRFLTAMAGAPDRPALRVVRLISPTESDGLTPPGVAHSVPVTRKG